jgi:hypothetical protein
MASAWSGVSPTIICHAGSIIGCHSCVDAPLDARGFSSDSGNVVRRFRVSGLIVRQFTRRGPVWKSEDRVQIGVARSKRSE